MFWILLHRYHLHEIFIWIPRFIDTATLVCVGYLRVILTGSNWPRYMPMVPLKRICFTHICHAPHWYYHIKLLFWVTRQESCSRRIQTILFLPRHSLFGFDITHSKGQKERREFHSVCQTWLEESNVSIQSTKIRRKSGWLLWKRSCREYMSAIDDLLVYLRSSVMAFPPFGVPFNASKSLKVSTPFGGKTSEASCTSFSRACRGDRSWDGMSKYSSCFLNSWEIHAMNIRG